MSRSSWNTEGEGQHRFVFCTLLVKYGVRSPKIIWAPCAQLYSLADTPQPPPPPWTPPHLGSYKYEGAIGQPR
jgi:hypothetical protein